MDNKLSELSKPVAWAFKDANDVEHASIIKKANLYGRHDFQPLYSQEYVSALLVELEAKDEQNKLLMREIEHGKKLRVNMQNNADSLSERIAELEAHNARLREWNAGLAQESCELQAKLATPVRLTDERTLWAGEDDYDTGHVKGWNANRIEQAALLKKQGFTVAEDA